ncbi:hypothetical protein [Commensalibacter papalotli (ex Botero et al. 2024)]|uniref:Uncharacterized protein n=1 Tax=Commensalibacter papalotli (ex Botero et al. 2024) TaxID=2972766 RepID=A0ABM9HJ15_9PROT|nr:hypothetical protein [Commensalibacter papalotli (ex Botero et al. 2024)]CAI3925769.1 unnamed protein product [Commensalibacter papalotli (ex Botero et al. 2024)]CAI3926288.1 unnamed protein product [Commensalibacter papalotli (ex Botero et al. 2024)]
MKITIQNYYDKKKYQTFFLLLVIACIHITRSPEVIIESRFWAEEGGFFLNAWLSNPIKSLFFSYGGYLNLPVNGATLLAKWCVPLKYAPYVTMIIGLLFQLLPTFLILTAKDKWLSSFKIRLLAALLLLFVPESLEISLQSLHIQFQLTLATAIILILDTQPIHQRWFKLSILFLTALSGVISIILIPLYLCRCLIDKDRPRIEQFLTLLVGNIIQFSFFYTSFNQRQYHTSFIDFLSIFFAKDIYLPLFGNNSLSNPYLLYLQSLVKNQQLPIFACSVSIFVLLLLIYCFYNYPRTRLAGYLLISALLNLALSTFGAIGPSYWFFEPYFNQRYAFINQSLMCLLLVYFIYSLPKLGKYFCITLSIWLLIANTYNYYHFVSHSYGVPPWRQQIKLIKQNPNINIAIWPKGWFIKIHSD